jgi:hypothetical protein
MANPEPAGDLTNHRFQPAASLFQSLAVCEAETY